MLLNNFLNYRRKNFMEKVFNAETLTVKGWEGFTTQQIGDALEKAIAEKEKMGFRVKKIVCGNAIIDLPSTSIFIKFAVNYC